MKKKILSLGVVVICLAILASGTIAYFSAEDTAHNVITTNGIGINIIEKTESDGGVLTDFPEGGISGVMPGTSVSKIVSVENDGGAEAWIRVQVEQGMKSADEKDLPLTLNGDTPAMTFTVDTSKWILEDGWYYYHKPVAAGAVTDILFEEVHFAPQMGNEYQNCTANIEILAQAVQTANNGSTVMDAQGWPTEVTE